MAQLHSKAVTKALEAAPSHADRRALFSAAGRWGLVVFAAAAVLAILLGLMEASGTGRGYERFFFAYISAYAFWLSLSIGALFFVMVQHITRAEWSVTTRRPAELLAGQMPLLAILFLPILAVVLADDGRVYPWAQTLPSEQPGYVETDAAEGHAKARTDPQLETLRFAAAQSDPHHAEGAAGQGKAAHGDAQAHGTGEHASPAKTQADVLYFTKKKRAYLNTGFFIVRWLIYFAVWIGLALYFLRQSTAQDERPDDRRTLDMEWVAAPGLILFAITVTFAAFDLLMSLDPGWFSSIFGVYYFAGSAVAVFATLVVLGVALQKTNLVAGHAISVEHYHDLGKFLFGFTVFWTYIGFSQYLLIWYGNIPEETGWLVRHGMSTALPNAWSPVVLLLLFGHFLIPFFALVSRSVKRKPMLLAGWAVWLLVMHWFDMLWLTMPEFDYTRLSIGLEFVMLIGLGGLFAAGFCYLAARHRLIPRHDPRLNACLAFENF